MSFKVGDKVRLLSFDELNTTGFIQWIRHDGTKYLSRAKSGSNVMFSERDLRHMNREATIMIVFRDNRYTLRFDDDSVMSRIPEDCLVNVPEVELSDQELAEDGAFNLEVSNIDELAMAMKKFEAWVKECKELGIGMMAWDGHVQLSRDNNSISSKL